MSIGEQVYGFFMPPVSLMGPGSSKKVGEQLNVLGAKKALIVTDKGLSKAGMAEDTKKLIEAAGAAAVVFDGAEPNPTDKNVEAGLKAFKDNGCDIIVSLGGGSSHDCAKGIRIVAANGGDIKDYEGVDKSDSSSVPMIAVNTTAGTASEMTRFCIITDTARKVKMAIVNWRGAAHPT